MSDTAPPLMVAEGVAGTWFYHLAQDGVSLCGAAVMPTAIPLAAWGTRTHLNERWCRECAARRKAER